MILPSADNLKARLPKDNTDDQRLERLKSNQISLQTGSAGKQEVTSEQ
jgi:hypothetical protein